MKRATEHTRKTVMPRHSHASNVFSGSGFESSFLDTKNRLRVNESKEIISDAPQERYFKDDVLFGSRYPSYTKFKVPYKMTCKRRYADNMARYENQIYKEIMQYIDFHSTAADACFLVRCMAITSLWPPLYSLKDLKRTSRYFCTLKPKEKTRLNIIMNTDII